MNIGIYLINAAFVIAILWRVNAIDNDKAPLLYMVFYPALLLFNLGTGGVLAFFKRLSAKPFLNVSKWMAILFIPLLGVVVYYL